MDQIGQGPSEALQSTLSCTCASGGSGVAAWKRRMGAAGAKAQAAGFYKQHTSPSSSSPCPRFFLCVLFFFSLLLSSSPVSSLLSSILSPLPSFLRLLFSSLLSLFCFSSFLKSSLQTLPCCLSQVTTSEGHPPQGSHQELQHGSRGAQGYPEMLGHAREQLSCSDFSTRRMGNYRYYVCSVEENKPLFPVIRILGYFFLNQYPCPPFWVIFPKSFLYVTISELVKHSVCATMCWPLYADGQTVYP